MRPASHAAALAAISLLAACSAGAEYHDVGGTGECLDARGLLVRHVAKEPPQLLMVYHSRTEQPLGQLEFYETNSAAAKVASEPPHLRLVTVPGEAIGNVVLRAIGDDREIRACL